MRNNHDVVLKYVVSTHAVRDFMGQANMRRWQISQKWNSHLFITSQFCLRKLRTPGTKQADG